MAHVNHLKKIKCAKQWEVCGIDVYTVCTLCPGRPGLHFFLTKGIAKGKQWYMDYYSDQFFGLAKSDLNLFKSKRIKDYIFFLNNVCHCTLRQMHKYS